MILRTMTTLQGSEVRFEGVDIILLTESECKTLLAAVRNVRGPLPDILVELREGLAVILEGE